MSERGGLLDRICCTIALTSAGIHWIAISRGPWDTALSVLTASYLLFYLAPLVWRAMRALHDTRSPLNRPGTHE